MYNSVTRNAITYDEVVKYEQCIENKEIVVFLFVKTTNQDVVDIIHEFEYIYYNSAKYCSIYVIGYSNDPQKQADRHYRKVSEIINTDWYFSSKAFVEFKNNLERRIKWEYSLWRKEVLILQNNPGKKNPLNFSTL